MMEKNVMEDETNLMDDGTKLMDDGKKLMDDGNKRNGLEAVLQFSQNKCSV
jgi:hypothetical protein